LAKGRQVDAAQVAAARQALVTCLPGLAQNAEHLEIAAQALAATRLQAGAGVAQMLGEMAHLDFAQLEHGALPLAQGGARTPVSQAVSALMEMSRASAQRAQPQRLVLPSWRVWPRGHWRSKRGPHRRVPSCAS
jgi:hypothetical protein